MKIINYYSVCFLLLLSSAASAQNKWSVSGDFSGYSFQKLVQEIESQTNYYFYYDSAETDSIRINSTPRPMFAIASTSLINWWV